MKALFAGFKAYFYAGIVVIAVLLLAGSFFFGIHYEKLESAATLEKQRIAFQILIDKEQSRYDDIAITFTGKLENLKIVNTTINKNFKKELTNTVYTTCVLPVTGVQLINDTAKKLNDTRNPK